MLCWINEEEYVRGMHGEVIGEDFDNNGRRELWLTKLSRTKTSFEFAKIGGDGW